MNVTKKIISICVIVSILSPVVSYAYFSQRYEKNSSLENARLLGVIEKLNQEKMNLTQRLDEAENLNKPNLITSIGWYLHKSTDPVFDSRNTFTIYGSIVNSGVYTALNCCLTIQFYDNVTLLQTSDIHMGDIDGRDNTVANNHNFYYITNRVIQCPSADSVTRIEIIPKWS